MDHQAQITRIAAEEPPARGVARSAAELWHHMMMLGELQLRLLSVELAVGIRRAKVGTVLLVIGFIVILVTLPVLLVAAALVITEHTQMTPAEAFGLVALVSFLISTGLIVTGILFLKRNPAGLPLSRRELTANWRWLKESLRQARGNPGRPPADYRHRAPAATGAWESTHRS